MENIEYFNYPKVAKEMKVPAALIKRIEKEIGITRSEEVEGVDGFEAVRLWKRYQKVLGQNGIRYLPAPTVSGPEKLYQQKDDPPDLHQHGVNGQFRLGRSRHPHLVEKHRRLIDEEYVPL